MVVEISIETDSTDMCFATFLETNKTRIENAIADEQ